MDGSHKEDLLFLLGIYSFDFAIIKYEILEIHNFCYVTKIMLVTKFIRVLELQTLKLYF